MKNVIPLLLALTSTAFAGKYDSAVKSFESAPGYVAPIATILGTFGSSGWNHQSFIGKEFAGSISLPINFVVIADEDRSYSSIFVDSTLFMSNLSAEEIARRAYVPFTTPTIFGKDSTKILHKSNIDIHQNVVSTTDSLLSNGIPDVASFNWIPMPTVQTEFSAYYTSIKLRYLGKPGKILGIHFPGVGIQHDFHSFLPKLPVNLTAFGNFSFPIINWRPGDNISGTLEMRGFSTFSGITVGKSIGRNKFDMMIEAGWEHSKLSTGGTLIINPTLPDTVIDTVTSDLQLEGRNKLRIGIVIAFNPGKRYRISGGYSGGAQMACMVDPLSFRFREKSAVVESKNVPSEPVLTPVQPIGAASLPVATPVLPNPEPVQVIETESVLTTPVSDEKMISADSMNSAHIETIETSTLPKEK